MRIPPIEMALVFAVGSAVVVAIGWQVVSPSNHTHRKCEYVCDKATEERVLLGCLERLPKGPERIAAAGNDWDEAISECRYAAHSIACADKCEIVQGWGIDQ